MRRSTLILLGLAAGLLSGLLGIGGGLVVGPVLALMGMTLRRASGTALAMVAPVALAGVLMESVLAPHQQEWKLAVLLAVGGFLGVQLGRSPARVLAESRLRLLFALLLLAVAARQFGLGGGVPHGPVVGLLPDAPLAQAAGAVLLGVVAGVCAILFGVGGGVVVVPGLIFLLGGVSPHAAAATSLLAMIPTAAFGAWGALRDGRVDVQPLRALLPAAIFGACGGVLLRNEGLDAPTLARCFSLFLIFVAVQLLLRRPRAR